MKSTKRGKSAVKKEYLSNKIDSFLYEEIKKRMAENPAVMNKFFNNQKNSMNEIE